VAHKLFLFNFFILPFLFATCNSIEPPPPPLEKAITLTLEDVSCIEAWITLSTNNLQLPATVTLKQNNITRTTINLIKPDTLLYIDSLLPNVNYNFQVSSIQHQVSSNELSVTTMDTTSHGFSWRTWEFGDISNSYLFDVAIINENNIWAVGEILIADTSATGYTKYNAVHWDGSEWTLHRIMFYTICGQQSRTPYPASSVFTFSENDVWIAMYGDQVARLDGTTQIATTCLPISFSIKKIWGENPNSIYAVGDMGKIVHYQNGIGWQVIESGTDADLLDVWGTPDGNIVWVSGREDGNKTVLIKIENNQTNIVFEDHYPWQIQEGRISGGISSIWTNSKNFIYMTTPITVYRCLSTTSGEGQEIYPYDDYLNGGTIRIRGTTSNDIITSGSNCSILHYNGFSWKRYEQFTDINTKLWSSDIRGNIMAAVGDKLENIFYYKAIIIVGYK